MEEKIDINGASERERLVRSDDAQNHMFEESKVDIADQIKPSATASDVVDAILNLPEEKLIPWETCELPSRGIYYGWQNGLIRVRAMTQVAEKILATQRLAQSGEAIDYLFRNCCEFPDKFDPAHLLIGDKTFILFYLRGITYGNMYEFAVKCPECANTSTFSYDLNMLAGTIKWADAAMGPGPFRIDLPHASKVTGQKVWINVRFLTSADVNGIAQRKKVRAKAVTKANVPGRRFADSKSIDDTITENLDMMTVAIMDSVVDRMRIKMFIEKLHAVDTSEIRSWLKDHTPGIDVTTELQCPDCDNEYKVGLPITEDFFRPAKPR